MKSVENGKRHRDMSDDGPRPQSIEVKLKRMTVSSRFLQSADGPHRQIGHQQKGHNLTSRFPLDLVQSHAAATRRVEYKHLENKKKKSLPHYHFFPNRYPIGIPIGRSPITVY